MILTEEQRAALKRVVAYMDRMYAITSQYYGCTEDSDLLRAMIDSSGTVADGDLGLDFGESNFVDDAVAVIDQQAARITELEDALVEERAGFLHYRASCYDPGRRCPYATGCNDCTSWDTCSALNRFHEDARSQLQAEGKIGPGADAKPRVWQITEERKAAIKELSELPTAIGCPSCHYYIQKNYGEDITVLRAMLTEADHDKP